MLWLLKDNKLDSAEKIQLVTAYILQIILIIAILISLFQDQWLIAFLTFGILILTLLPAFIQHSSKVYLPVEFHFIPILFIFLALYLGELHGYYTYFWWWDVVLHTTSGILLGIAGFVLIYVLNEEKKIFNRLRPGFMALFSFTFAVAIGAIWEIFEFTLDSNFGFNLQKSGLVDTMWDLIVDVAGALFIAILGFFYVRSKNYSILFSRFVHRFVEKNQRLFSK
ncbi:MAG TPA: hypothetical protein VJB66_02805 [Candidatus Nanoarchaeia archaeon]|nr:hypothetical protein [Candidatus Nanoarchaeia archaeon]